MGRPSKEVETIDSNKDEIAELKRQLAEANSARSQAEQVAEALSQSSQFVNLRNDDFPTGETVTVKKCLNPWEKDEKKHKFHNVELPTYKYTINLPVSAVSLSTNGVEYYHGMTYTFDQETLAEMKSRVALCWKHEESINGSNENAYRKQTQQRVG